MGLCNSSANCCCQIIPDGFFSLNQVRVSVLCLLDFQLTSGPIVFHYRERNPTILPFFYPLHFCTSGYLHRHYNQHHVSSLLHLSAQLVDHKFLIFHQFLDFILLGFLNHYKDLYICWSQQFSKGLVDVQSTSIKIFPVCFIVFLWPYFG